MILAFVKFYCNTQYKYKAAKEKRIYQNEFYSFFSVYFRFNSSSNYPYFDYSSEIQLLKIFYYFQILIPELQSGYL